MDATLAKIRALIEDWVKTDFEVYTYAEFTDAGTITLSTKNIVSVSRVLRNGTLLGSASWDFDSTTNELSLLVSALVSTDVIQADVTHYKYSDTELTEYVRAALVWINTYSGEDSQYEIVDDEIEDSDEDAPTARISDLIALVASILIKPDYSIYKLPTVTVTYTGRKTKEEKIEKLVKVFFMSKGVMDCLEYNITL